MKCINGSHVFTIAIFSIVAFGCKHATLIRRTAFKGNAYYIAAEGNDAGTGSKARPWKSIEKINSIQLRPGDMVFFQGGKTFSGNLLLDSTDAGTEESEIILTSTANSSATIDGGNLTALTIKNSAYIKINQLHFIGLGRKNGNTKDGVVITNSRYISVDSLDVSGFQKSGLLVNASHNIEVKNVYAHDNGFAGILISGDKKGSSDNIHVTGCAAVNNPGDPTNLNSHSGNGILAGNCKKVLIEYSSATNNGWDIPRIGNGPVGIWAYEADSVVIQNCISYKNKTSVGGEDGGGYDFDGGVTNSTIQQCLSHDNQGSGFGIFQYAGATDWHDNIIRNNISVNDGNVSRAGASAFIWNGSKDKNQFKNLQFYNNILYNSKGAVLRYDNKESEHTGVKLTADKTILKADGEDLSYITVELVDAKGYRNPKAENLVKFQIEGAGTIVGVGNANPVSLESYQRPQRKAWKGRCLVIVKSEKEAGSIKLKVIVDGIGTAQTMITAK
jgi:hypothetical protein